MKERFRPIVGHRRLNRQGGSVLMSIPKEWLEYHGLLNARELLVVANQDIRIVHPNCEKDVDTALHDLVRKGVYIARDED